MTPNPYKEHEIGGVSNHYITTYLSFLYMKLWEKRLKPFYSQDSLVNIWVVFNFMFFLESFRVGLSELYTFFHRKNDKYVLDKLTLPLPRRKILRKARHAYVHIEGTEFLASEEEFFKKDIQYWIDDMRTFEVVFYEYLRKYEPKYLHVFAGGINSIKTKFEYEDLETFIKNPLIKRKQENVS